MKKRWKCLLGAGAGVVLALGTYVLWPSDNKSDNKDLTPVVESAIQKPVVQKKNIEKQNRIDPNEMHNEIRRILGEIAPKKEYVPEPDFEEDYEDYEDYEDPYESEASCLDDLACDNFEAKTHRHRYPNGQVAIRGKMICDRLHGKWEAFFWDGDVESVKDYACGKLEGWVTKWWSLNKRKYRKYECPYINGLKHGWEREWHDNGQRAYLGKYDMGKKIGEHKKWDSDGQLTELTPYVNGIKHGKEISWFDNGQKEKEMPFVNGRPHGEPKEWYRNGRIKKNSKLEE